MKANPSLFAAGAVALVFWFFTAAGCDQHPPDDNSTTTTTSIMFNTGCECEPLPAASGTTVSAATVDELIAAVEQANSRGSLTILVEDGTYTLPDMLWISADNITVRSRSGNRDRVIIRGQGMNGPVGFIFNVAGSSFTAADMTLGWVANHAIQIHGDTDADNPLIHNIRFVDTYEQMLKISYAEGTAQRSNSGVVQCCVFEYSAGIGPQYYIGGIDGHWCRDWTVRNNTFLHIRSPEADLAEYAVHFWTDSENTVVENNCIIDCDRGIGFGLGDRGHSGGIIANNMVHTTRDVGIGLENASAAKVYNNSVFTENYDNSIEYRFSGSSGISIINNLTNGLIALRDGAAATLDSNYTQADTSFFTDAAAGDLHLAAARSAVVDAGTELSEVTQDIDCEQRPKGAAFDIGADEY